MERKFQVDIRLEREQQEIRKHVKVKICRAFDSCFS